jgi:hypothetical protein
MGDRLLVVTPLTTYSDHSELKLSTFTFRDLAIGDRLKISGTSAGGVIYASTIERKPNGHKGRAKGK